MISILLGVVVIVIVLAFAYTKYSSASLSTVTFYSQEQYTGETKTFEFIPGVKYPMLNSSCGYSKFLIGFKPLSFKFDNVANITSKKYKLSITGNWGSNINTVNKECGIVNTGALYITTDKHGNIRSLVGADKYDKSNGAIFFDYTDMIY